MKEITKCDLCSYETIEGDYGESKYICKNSNCERSNPHWSLQDLKKLLLPLSNEKKNLLSFKYGIIEFFDARYLGDGSAEIQLINGERFMCHVENGKFEPFDSPYFYSLDLDISKDAIQEVKERMLRLVAIRAEVNEIMRRK